jgi:pimeloyl-ACP methyl ester carboxylesterase
MNAHEDTVTPRGVLLVHGAWYRASLWSAVAQRLVALGIPVGIPDLHRGSLAADIEAATSALDAIETTSPVIACGHSYGGTVITGLDPAKVAHLVYMAGPMPDVGETSLGLLASEPTGLVAALREQGTGTTVIDPDLAGDLLFSQLDAERRTVNIEALAPQVMAAGDDRTGCLHGVEGQGGGLDIGCERTSVQVGYPDRYTQRHQSAGNPGPQAGPVPSPMDQQDSPADQLVSLPGGILP